MRLAFGNLSRMGIILCLLANYKDSYQNFEKKSEALRLQVKTKNI